jgi:C1A family cysteine protease
MKKYFIPLFFVLLSCGDNIEGTLQDLFGKGLEESNVEVIPQDVLNFSKDAAGLPSSVSLEDKFPPVQSQGQYGTCVAWSTGYAFKTALNAIDKNWSSSDLAKPSNQTSPKDVWLAISSDRKGNNCGGTAFEAAIDALIAKGAASMDEVPYNMSSGACNASSSTAKGNSNNKLANYRKIAVNQKISGTGNKVEGMDVENFKSYLAQGRPIIFAAPVGDRFSNWSSSAVFSSDYGNMGGHAMVLVGYDDSKGAFRVRNSWGERWGDKGSIWVDYNHFVTNFCKYAFVAQNPNSSPNNPPDNPPNPPVSGTYDLLTSLAEDYQDPERSNPRARAFFYEIYNNGAKEILASQKWSVYYMYYNAYDAYDYEIIFEDYYTNENGQPCTKPEDFDNQVCWGEYKDTEAVAGAIWNNMNIKPGKMAGEAEAGDYGFEIPYTMPNSINGDYYLLAYADPEDVIGESNEDNNFYFIADKAGKPLNFKNGVMQSTPANSSAVLNKRQRPAPVHSVVDLGELNAYTPQEIKTLLNRDKKNGTLAKKIAEYRENPAHPVKRIRKQR